MRPDIAFLAVVSVFSFSITPSFADSGRPIPNVLGMTRVEASSKLRRAGFRVHVGYGDSCDFPKGVISRQQPSEGVEAKLGSVVIVLENQSGGFKMPNFVGLSYEDASRRAVELGFDIALEQSSVAIRNDLPATCDTPSETWSPIRAQSPSEGVAICLEGSKRVLMSRTKLKQKAASDAVCYPRERHICHKMEFC
jgi:beta-lactam-binding protein with PASTA domain